MKFEKEYWAGTLFNKFKLITVFNASFFLFYSSSLQKFTKDGSKIFDYVCATKIVDHALDNGQTTSLW